MERAYLDGLELEYQLHGTGEPLLFIAPVLADGFLPLTSEPALADRYHLIRYRRRGWGGSTHTPAPVEMADHAADAAALLEHLGIGRAHVAGHSSGGDIALELALLRPDLVHSLTLLEPSLFSVPSAASLLGRAAPALEAQRSGDPETAVGVFLSVVSGLDPETCRRTIEDRIPGALAAAVRDAETLFDVELPAVQRWRFGPERAAAITCPALFVIGGETQRLWAEVAELLRSWLPQLETIEVPGVGHLLHVQDPEPVAKAIARFLGRHPLDPRLADPAALQSAR